MFVLYIPYIRVVFRHRQELFFVGEMEELGQDREWGHGSLTGTDFADWDLFLLARSGTSSPSVQIPGAEQLWLCPTGTVTW